MKAFWWFKEKSIAGMGRPGFNAVHWFDLSFVDALLLGWFGKFSSGIESTHSFRNHLKDHGLRINQFYGVDAETAVRSLKIFDENGGIIERVERLNRRTEVLETFEITDDHLHFQLSERRLRYEVEFLRSHGISRVVSLTESHHQKEFLQEHFELFHIGIEDLGAPNLDQAIQLAEIIKTSTKDQKAIAVHCMAGIGRTSTVLMASHILMGERADDLENLLKRQNPTFIITGDQGKFLRSLSAK